MKTTLEYAFFSCLNPQKCAHPILFKFGIYGQRSHLTFSIINILIVDCNCVFFLNNKKIVRDRKYRFLHQEYSFYGNFKINLFPNFC